MVATTAEATTPATCVCERAASLMTVRASLPAAGMPCTRLAAKLAAASPKSSPLAAERVVVLVREHAARERRARVDEQGDAERAGNEAQDRAGPQGGESDRGQALVDGPEHSDPARLEVEQGGQRDPGRHHDGGAGEQWEDAARDEEEYQRRGGQPEGGPVNGSKLRGDLRDAWNEFVRVAPDAEHPRELRGDQHQRDPVDVADEDRP